MGFWDGLAEGGVTGLFKGAGDFAKSIRTAVTGKEPITSEQQLEISRQAQALEMLAGQIEASAAAGQLELNKIDAQSGSLFKGGWRPALGWCCVLGLVYTFLIRPLLPWTVEVVCLVSDKTVTLPAMPALDTQELMALVMALLGMGGFRMFEKVRGVASK